MSTLSGMQQLQRDPMGSLLLADDAALQSMARRELLGESPAEISLAELPALDSLARIGFRADDPDIARGVAWFLENQDPNGLWNTGRNRPKGPHSDLWAGLAICRMLHGVSA